MSKRQKSRVRIRGRTPRAIGVREVRQRFLIVCEGERTEPDYFRSFQVPGLVVTAKGLAESTLKLVEEARRLSNEDEGKYDQVWVVFDRDDAVSDHVHRAIELAIKYGFGVAFSNQAFELWYLLHFDYHHVAITRRDYCQRLSRLLGHEYVKGSKTLYQELIQRQSDAIRNARRLIAQYDLRRPADNDPSTTVYELVEELNKHRRP